MKIAVIIDGPNVRCMTSFLGQNIDFLKFLKHVRGPERQISIKKVFYDAIPSSLYTNPFAASLHENYGFEAIPAPLKEFNRTTSLGQNFKSRTDQMITLHIAKHLYKYGEATFGHLVLVAGDSDYEFLIDACHEEGKTVEVWATPQTISNNLMDKADKYYLFTDPYHTHLLMPTQNNCQNRINAAVNS